MRTSRLDAAVEALLSRVRSRLETHYGPRLAGVVLYGSVARRTEEPESDVDLLILLRGELDYFRELRSLVEVLYPVQLESERLISALPVSLAEYEAGSLQLHRNAAREGLAV
jgi:predicted nucleotidyltransferase